MKIGTDGGPVKNRRRLPRRFEFRTIPPVPRPIVLIALLFIAGLVAGVAVPVLGGWTALAAATVCLATAAGAIRRRELDPGSRWVLLAVLPLGLWQGARIESGWREAQAALRPLATARTVTVCGVLCAEPRFTARGVSLRLFPVELGSRDGTRVAPEMPIEIDIIRREESELATSGLALGDTVTAEGLLALDPPVRNPGGFDRQSWNWERGVAANVTVTVPATVRIASGEPSLRARVLRACRGLSEGVAAMLDRQQGREAAAFSRALLLGDRQWLGAPDRHAFLLTGLAHLFAVSGLHTAMIYTMLVLLLRLLRCPWRLCLGMGLIALAPYIVMVGFQPSVLRAGVMITALVAGRLLGRTVDSLSAISLAALAICAVDPRAPWQPGFQMSFLATLGLLLHAPLFRDLAPDEDTRVRWPRWCLLSVLGVTAVQVALLPVTAEVYGLWSWVALPMNLLLVPLSFVIQAGAGLGILLGVTAPPLGGLLGWATGRIVEAMLDLVRWVSLWPGAAVTMTPLPLWAVAAWYAILFGGPAVLRATAPDERLRRRARALIAWAGLAAIAVALPLTAPDSQRLRVTFLDVGQGDATLIETPDGLVAVVDAGRARPADRGRTVVEPALRARGIREIDLLVASHADADHIGGLPHLLRTFPVRVVAEGVPGATTEEYAEFQAALAGSGARHVLLDRGDVIRSGDCVLSVLHPDPDPRFQAPDTNNNSVVLNVALGETDIVIFGDAEVPAERVMLANLPDLDCDVMRTGHHGSRNATGAAYLAASTPSTAVISCGQRNPYGHPHPDTLARLEAAGARVLRIDQLGAVTVETDGRTIWISAAAWE